MKAAIQSLDVERVSGVLASAAARVKAIGSGAWRFSLEPGAPMRGSAAIEEGWLLMRAAFGGGRAEAATRPPDRLWDLLAWNAGLSGGAKFVLDAADRVQVRAEIPLDDDEAANDPTEFIEDSCRGFREAFSRAPATGGPADQEGGLAGADLPALLTAAGWPYTARSNGDLAVSLDVPHGFHQALVRPKERRGLSFSTDLCSGRQMTAKSREALAALLLTTSAVVRMARAAAGEEEAGPAARFEVILSGRLSPAQAGHALSALSVGCRWCGAECALLARNEHLAEQYLAVRGWSSAGARVERLE